MTTEASSRQGSGVATGPSLNPQVIGRAENALRALLERTLAGTGLEYRHWIALSLSLGNDVPVSEDELIDRITAVLQVDHTTARETIADLRARRLAETVPGNGSGCGPPTQADSSIVKSARRSARSSTACFWTSRLMTWRPQAEC
jgi:hypothetical protein